MSDLFTKVLSSGDRHIPDESGRTPDKGIVPLVPIDKGLSQGDARDGGPTPAQTDVVLVVEKVGRVPRVQLHGGKPLVGGEGRAGPFPEPADVGLAAEPVVAGDGSRVEVAEGDVLGVRQRDEEVVRVEIVGVSVVWCSTAVRGSAASGERRVVWWCFLDTFVREVSKI